MAGNNMNWVDAMPFHNLSDFEIFTEQQLVRNNLVEKMENNGFKNYFRLHRTDVVETSNASLKKQYYDTDEFANKFRHIECDISLFHMNIRRLCKNKGNLLALLSTLEF